MDRILSIVGRQRELFTDDIAKHEPDLRRLVGEGSFLVIGGAGSIGQAVVREIFRRQPRLLHVVDLSENRLVELVRDLRSSLGYIRGEFRALPLDCGSPEFETFFGSRPEPYQYILNLSALKHVRSEKDPFTLMRLIQVNILNVKTLVEQAVENGCHRLFCVSTDKAANPVNMMGASKRIMELFLMRGSLQIPISTARFANVAFSDGSLLHGFTERVQKRQPLSAPRDVRRYFMTPKESGELCLLSSLLGENRDIFFPKPTQELSLTTFDGIAERYLASLGYRAHPCETEDEARADVESLAARGEWPCYFFDTDTTGEKEFEEFFTDLDRPDFTRFQAVGVLPCAPVYSAEALLRFEREITRLRERRTWVKEELVDLFRAVLPEFRHQETGRYLDYRM